jgi:hypothetical protein
MRVEEMGLGTNQRTTSYIQASRVAWVAARSSLTSIGNTRLSTDTRSVQLGFANESKFNSGLSSIRELQRARNHLSYAQDKLLSNVLPQLTPIVEKHVLYPLLLEMSKKQAKKSEHEHSDVLSPPNISEPGWSDIVDNDELFSTEYKNEFRGNQKTVREFWNAYRKRVNKAVIPSSSIETRLQKTIREKKEREQEEQEEQEQKEREEEQQEQKEREEEPEEKEEE